MGHRTARTSLAHKLKSTRSGVGEGEIGSRARLRTSGLPSAGTGSIDPAKGKAYPR